MPSLLLGTAQWGLDYGITNSAGRIPDSELLEIVDLAQRRGIQMLDTAPAYGDAEIRLGEVGSSFGIQTKVSGAQAGQVGIVDQLRASLDRLGREAVVGVLVHDWAALDPENRDAARRGLLEAKNLGLVDDIGVSLYEVEDLRRLSEEFAEATVVQAPASLLDQRMVGQWRGTGGAESEVRLQVRSVFLQGAALSGSDQMPFGAHPDVVRVREAARDLGCTPLQLSLDFVRSQPEIDEVVLGVTSARELAELLDACEREPLRFDWSELESLDLELIDPRAWTRPI